jgi:hypothetical protein
MFLRQIVFSSRCRAGAEEIVEHSVLYCVNNYGDSWKDGQVVRLYGQRLGCDARLSTFSYSVIRYT